MGSIFHNIEAFKEECCILLDDLNEYLDKLHCGRYIPYPTWEEVEANYGDYDYFECKFKN